MLIGGLPYATLQDFALAALPPKATVNVSVAVIQKALLDASGEMDDRGFNARFVLPLVSVGPGTVQKCCDLAAWYSLKLRGFDPNSDPAVKLGYTEAIKWLDDVANDRAQPVVVDSSSGGDTAAAPMVASSPSRGWESPVVID